MFKEQNEGQYTWGLVRRAQWSQMRLESWKARQRCDIQQIIYYLLMRGAKGWCDGAEVVGSFSSDVGSQHWCEVKRTELSDSFISLKRKHLYSDSKEMPLRYLSLTLVVTERKAHCFLILSYLICHWLSQPDYFFGWQWEYYYCLAFAQLWHFVPTYRTHDKYCPCSWGMEMLKRFVPSHYPLSGVSIWSVWLPRVLETSGWIESLWAECPGSLGLQEAPGCTPVCRESCFLNLTVILLLLA